MFTAWVETVGRGEGAAFELTLLERGSAGGPGDLVLPGQAVLAGGPDLHLPALAGQPGSMVAISVPGGGVAGLLAVLWRLRRRWRGPLAALLFFVGTLFPVLGFFNVYPFIYSYVADHFQYLASLGIITLLASAGAALLLERWGLWRRPGGYVLCLALLAVLGSLTWRQSRMYADIETLYRATIAGNPDCWMAHNNLGMALAGQRTSRRGDRRVSEALEIKPDFAEAHNNLGMPWPAGGRSMRPSPITGRH